MNIASEKRYLILSIVISVALLLLGVSVDISVAEDGQELAWYTILPSESDLSIQQQRVVRSLDITLTELESVIDKGLKSRQISADTDFTTDGDVALVYDYLMYRIYELIKVDRRIREDFAAREASLKEEHVPRSVLQQHYAIKDAYEKRVSAFLSSLDGLKRSVLIKDLRSELKKMRTSLAELKPITNIYYSYTVAVASR